MCGQVVHEHLPLDCITYNACLDALVKGGQWEKAIQLFHEMRAKGIHENTNTISIVIIAYGNGKQWEAAVDEFYAADDNSITPDKVCFYALGRFVVVVQPPFRRILGSTCQPLISCVGLHLFCLRT